MYPAMVMAGGFIAVASLQLRPIDGAPAIAAFFPPWWDQARTAGAAAEADADIIQFGAVPSLVTVRSESPNLRERLRAAGAVLLLNPEFLSLCVRSDVP